MYIKISEIISPKNMRFPKDFNDYKLQECEGYNCIYIIGFRPLFSFEKCKHFINRKEENDKC